MSATNVATRANGETFLSATMCPRLPGPLELHFLDFSLVLVSIKKIYQALKTVLEHISKHLEVCQKYSVTRRIFNLFLVV